MALSACFGIVSIIGDCLVIVTRVGGPLRSS